MIDDWRYNPERLEQRRFCLSALIRNGVQVDRKCYQFCHDFTSSGAAGGLIERYQSTGDVEALFKAIYASYLSYLGETDFQEQWTLTPMTTDQILDTYAKP